METKTGKHTDSTNIHINVPKIIQGNTVCYPLNELIHQEQVIRVCKILSERLKQAEGYNPLNEDFISINDVISIFARRGAGKTTFVKSLVNLIRYSDEKPFDTIGKGLYCLDVFEPDQISNKENLMIRFIAHIHKVFENCKKSKENNHSYENDSNIKSHNTATHKLYEALPVIEGIGSSSLYSDWDDSAYLADMNMESSMRIKDLERRFHQYIAAGLKLLGKKALLFVLDDCDINTEKTFQILEYVRLYFTSPQIIVMMTGDAALYGMAIRKNYWQFFNREFLEKETRLDEHNQKFKEYKKMVYRLETQYFQKMIKADHRIFLNNPYDKLQNWNRSEETAESHILIGLGQLDSESQNEEVEIRELYKKAFALMEISARNHGVINSYVNHMLAQPFRNQIRFFSAYNHAIQQNPESSRSAFFVQGVLKVFEVYINQLTGDSKFLMAHTPIYAAWLLKFLVENKQLSVGSSLLPKMEDDSFKNAIIALGISCGEQMKHDKSMVFDYWIRISLTRLMLDFLQKEEQATSLIDFAHLYSDTGLSKILGHMIAYCIQKQQSRDETKSVPGIITTDRALVRHKYSLTGNLVQLLQLYTISDDGEISHVFSIYRIFAFIGEILRTYINNDGDKDDFWNLFSRHCQIRSYIEPDNNENVHKNPYWTEDRPLIIDEFLKNDRRDTDRFIEFMDSWISKSNELLHIVPPYWIDHIFSRFFYTVFYIDNPSYSLGERISNTVIAFWNAVIVESFIAANSSTLITLDHEGNIKQIFLKNYRTFLDKRHLLDYQETIVWMLECPLLKEYVDPYISYILHMEKAILPADDIKTDMFMDTVDIEPIIKLHDDKKLIETLRSVDFVKVLEEKSRQERIQKLHSEINILDGKIKKLADLSERYKQYKSLQDDIFSDEIRFDYYKDMADDRRRNRENREYFIQKVTETQKSISEKEEKAMSYHNLIGDNEDWRKEWQKIINEQERLSQSLSNKKAQLQELEESRTPEEYRQLHKILDKFYTNGISVYSILNSFNS